jgi:hypothetical protein
MSVITCIFSKPPVTGRHFALPLAKPKVLRMEKKYWIGRKHEAMAMARAATSSVARLIHYDLAGRYSVLAAVAPAAAARAEARPMLHLRDPGSAAPVRGDPPARRGEVR